MAIGEASAAHRPWAPRFLEQTCIYIYIYIYIYTHIYIYIFIIVISIIRIQTNIITVLADGALLLGGNAAAAAAHLHTRVLDSGLRGG